MSEHSRATDGEIVEYRLTYADGRADDVIAATDDADAESQALSTLGDAAVAADQWDADGQDGSERLLLWATEATSRNDAGQHAAASLRRADRRAMEEPSTG